MTGYRVADEPADPLAVDEALCKSQRWYQRFAVHALFSAITAGLWLPGLVGWLAISGSLTKKFSAGYTVRIQGGVLTVGNAYESRSVPLDAIADASLKSGLLVISVRGATPLHVFGLRDPVTASQTILEARDAHVRGLRSEHREEVVEAEVGVPRTRTGR